MTQVPDSLIYKSMATILALALGACSATTTSGGQPGYTKQDALADIQAAKAQNANTVQTDLQSGTVPEDGIAREMQLDAEVAALYKVAPQISFPARIALVRLNNYGEITRPGEGEIADFSKLAEKLGPEFGEFLVLDPVMAEMAAETVEAQEQNARANLRRGAALIKADYALAYTVDSSSRSSENVLSITDWTIIGLWLAPSRNVRADSVAQAAFIDIRTGLPMGSTSAEADSEAIARFSTEHSRKRDLAETAEAAAIAELVTNVEDLAIQLMQDARAQQAVEVENRSMPAPET